MTINNRLPSKSHSKMYGAEPRYNDLRYNNIPGLTMGLCGCRKYPCPPWKVSGISVGVGGLEVQVSKGCVCVGGGGSRRVQEHCLRENFQYRIYDLSTNRWTPVYFSVLKW